LDYVITDNFDGGIIIIIRGNKEYQDANLNKLLSQYFPRVCNENI